MFDLLLTGPFVPFSISLALLMGLLALEVVLALIGGTLLGLGADTGIDAGPGTAALANLDVGLDASDLVDVELADLDVGVGSGPVSIMDAGPASWLGVGRVPFLIWVAALLLGFGLGGVLLQQASLGVSGSTLPVVLASAIAGGIGVWFTRQFSGVFARILPKTETEALSERHLGRRTGLITLGDAKRGSPAEVRVTDRFGNIHHLRGEPLKDGETIRQGSTVLVLRHRRQQGYRLVALSAEP